MFFSQSTIISIFENSNSKLFVPHNTDFIEGECSAQLIFKTRINFTLKK